MEGVPMTDNPERMTAGELQGIHETAEQPWAADSIARRLLRELDATRAELTEAHEEIEHQKKNREINAKELLKEMNHTQQLERDLQAAREQFEAVIEDGLAMPTTLPVVDYLHACRNVRKSADEATARADRLTEENAALVKALEEIVYAKAKNNGMWIAFAAAEALLKKAKSTQEKES
jgi:hypothetical protein